MRCVIARYPFELTKGGVLAAVKGARPEPVTGESVTIGRRRFPAKQVGQLVTGQDRRDFTSGEVVRAMTRLGFTCHDAAEAPPADLPAVSAATSAATSASVSTPASTWTPASQPRGSGAVVFPEA